MCIQVSKCVTTCPYRDSTFALVWWNCTCPHHPKTHTEDTIFVKNHADAASRGGSWFAASLMFPQGRLWSCPFQVILSVENKAQLVWTCAYEEKHNVWKSVWAHFIVIRVVVKEYQIFLWQNRTRVDILIRFHQPHLMWQSHDDLYIRPPWPILFCWWSLADKYSFLLSA